MKTAIVNTGSDNMKKYILVVWLHSASMSNLKFPLVYLWLDAPNNEVAELMGHYIADIAQKDMQGSNILELYNMITWTLENAIPNRFLT